MNQIIYKFDEFEVDTQKRVLRRSGQIVQLTSKAFDLLTALIESGGREITKNELINQVWLNQIVEDANLTVTMSHVRKALGEKANEHRFIVTIPGRGYRFIGAITKTNGKVDFSGEADISDKNGRKFSATPVNFTNVVDKKFPFSKSVIIGAALILIAFGIGGVWLLRNNLNVRPTTFSSPQTEKQLPLKRLTTNGRVNLAALSPDGKFFAYSIYEKGTYRTELRLGQTDGGNDVALLPMGDSVYNPKAFSADGGWLYYMQSKPRERVGTLYKISVLGGVSQKIMSGVNIYSVISPDEKQIAFIRVNSENKTSALVVVNLDGTNGQELVVRPAEQSISQTSLAWSPDGKMLAFGASTGIDENYGIFAVNTGDGKTTPLSAPDWIEVARLEWLKDGKGLLAVARNKDSTFLTQIWQIDYPTGAIRRVVSDLIRYGSMISLSADSSRFLVIQVNAESNIFVAPAGNLAAARQITFGSLGRQDGWFGMDWTADGKIVYAAQTDQSSMLWIMDADGKNVRQITPPGFRDVSPSVSADGKFVVFGSNRSGKSEIWRVGIDGDNLQQLTNDEGNSNASLTPDGKYLFYQHTSGKRFVYRLPLEGGEAVRLTVLDSFSPRVSPDGKFFACGYKKDEKTKLAVFSIEGGEPLKLFDVPPTYNFDSAAIRWSPDGKFISYRDWANGIWQQSIEGGEPKLLEGLPAEKFYTYGWSPDGKSFAFTRGREVRDAVLITDFR